MKHSFRVIYETIGKNLRIIRLTLGYTQDALAQRCSVNSAKISKIENARCDYMLSTLLTICSVLKCDVEYLVGEEIQEANVINGMLVIVKKKES